MIFGAPSLVVGGDGEPRRLDGRPRMFTFERGEPHAFKGLGPGPTFVVAFSERVPRTERLDRDLLIPGAPVPGDSDAPR